VKRSLTPNERRVLYGLVREATKNDRELSESLGIKVSTVTAIRRRLRRADYFLTRRIPMMHRLGWEILAAGYGTLSPARGESATGRLRDLLGDRYPSVFHFVDAPDHFLFLAVSKDYTSFARDLEDLRVAMFKGGFLDDAPVSTVILPLGLALIGNFFDFSQVLSIAFGFDGKRPLRLEPAKVGDVELTRKETDVLVGLVRFPELADKAVAAKIKASRQAVSKMRREFEATGLLVTAHLPNVRALGFELYGSVVTRFAPGATIKARMDGIERVLRSTPNFFHAASNSDAVLLGAVRSYEHFSSLRMTLAKHYTDRGFFAGDPTIHLGLVSMTEVLRNCDFSPAVQTLRATPSRQ
jgi:DNA-binding MarR family transcriptional regulator